MNKTEPKDAVSTLGPLQGLRLFLAIRKDPLRGFCDLQQEYGDFIRWKGPYTTYQFTHPADVQHVLQTNPGNYHKGRSYRISRSFIGEGLLTSEGAFWRRQRRIIQPAFSHDRLGSFATIMTQASQELMQRWCERARRSEEVELVSEFRHLTLTIVGRTLFSTDLTGRVRAVSEALDIGREYSAQRSWALMKLPESLPTPQNRRYRDAVRRSFAIVSELIEEHRRHPGNYEDLLAMLLEARDPETGEAMSNQQLLDESSTLLLAGHETTTLALAWALYLLALHPDAERELRNELQTVLGGRIPTSADLARLKFTRMVLEEAMRLYPPAWTISRTAIGDDEIRQQRIRPGDEILLLQYVTHRHPDFWDEPDQFRPERFTAANCAARPRYAYFPFAGGPRQCVGIHFAMMEAQLVLATITPRFNWHLVSGHPVIPEPSVTLRPRHGIRVTLEQT
jgi:cytochrome P450